MDYLKKLLVIQFWIILSIKRKFIPINVSTQMIILVKKLLKG